MASDSVSVPPRPSFGMRGVETPEKGALGRKATWRKSKTPVRDPGEAKRNAAMLVVALGAGAFGIWAFATSSSGKDAHGKIYTSARECAADGAVGQANCARLWREALVLHKNKAPTYPTQAKCEAVHGAGRCEQPSGAQDSARRAMYIPRMSGYAMGRLAFGGYQAAPLYKRKTDLAKQYRMSAAPEPVRDSQGRRVSAFVWISRANANSKAKSPARGRPLFGRPKNPIRRSVAPSRPTRSAAAPSRRGGFGGSSRGRSARG